MHRRERGVAHSRVFLLRPGRAHTPVYYASEFFPEQCDCEPHPLSIRSAIFCCRAPHDTSELLTFCQRWVGRLEDWTQNVRWAPHGTVATARFSSWRRSVAVQ